MAREVWVWAERRRGRLLPVALELLGRARGLARDLGAVPAAVVAGHGVEEAAGELFARGADRVYLLDHPLLEPYQAEACAELLAGLARERGPAAILLGATALGPELAARVAARLGTGLTAHCVDLYVNEEGRLVQVVPGLNPGTLWEYVCLTDPQMATVKPGVFPLPAPEPGRRGEVVRVPCEVREESLRARTLEAVEGEPAGPSLEEAGVVVAAGWGLRDAGGIEAARELARLLGAALGGTRPAVDQGWLPEELMIGQSGRTVSPRLFVSLGASGAMHFTTGFLGSGVVFAVDQNPRAPIFEVADVGIVGDLREVLPLLVGELRKRGVHPPPAK
ncbi:MAG: electron transfer flavoprotein subunit alpha/FixB family protein [Firmicutes bacterium]|nr:electron transfer flavoprotein subunit alpha/FixB family protein [Bacillota bacterium]